MADEHFTGVCHTALTMRQCIYSCHQIQAGMILPGPVAVGNPALDKGGMLIESDIELSQRLIMPHGIGSAHHILRNQIFGFPHLSGKYFFPNEGQCLFCGGIVAVDKFSVPETVLVELNSLHGSMPVHHGTQAAVAHGKCFFPDLCRSVVFHSPCSFFHNPLPFCESCPRGQRHHCQQLFASCFSEVT